MINSSIAWLDFSDEDRRKVMEVVSLFKERDTRDELGLGSIRDTLADLLFPGTSTIQTRARYFLFVPWLYLGYERRGLSSDKVVRRLRQDETKLIDALKAAGETEGVIGRISGASLQRFPSSIYWNGLQRWGVLRFPGSQSQYHRLFGVLAGMQRGGRALDEWEPLDEDMLITWDPNLPDPPDDFPAQADLSLRPEDASYLQERLLLNCSESLLAYLVDRCAPVEDVDFAWLHPQAAEFPARLREWLPHARNFSEAMYGAALLYNLMLAELCAYEALVSEYRDLLGEWRAELMTRAAHLRNWDRSAFWSLVTDTGRIPGLTQAFVNDWLDLLLSGPSIPHLAQHKEARRLVREREVWLKRGRSRFDSPRHLELWSGAAGAYQLDYRWFVARRITNDILRGLGVD
jgi:hypothetical protein